MNKRYLDAAKAFLVGEERPFRNCHASTITVLPGGELVAAWFGGTEESAPDVAIWSVRRTEAGWSKPQVAADAPGVACWNPVLLQAQNGELQLYFKVGDHVQRWHTRVAKSADGGQTWGEAAVLVPGDIGGRGPVRCKPIYLASGMLAAPASEESPGVWDAFVDLSDDHGATWQRGANVPLDHSRFPGDGIIQPTLWESGAGLHMLLRSSAGSIYRSDSADGGKTWCEAYSSGLPNNNSGIDVAQLPDGTLALVYNPVGQNAGPRTPLVLRLSSDGGQTWDSELVLEDEPGEYSYPAIVADGNKLYITYTWRRENIAFWEIEVNVQASAG